MEINKDIIKTSPTDWADLLKPEFKNSIALAGDPRTANQAIQGVYAAGLSQSGGDAAKAGEAGLKFFAELNKAGNFVPVIGKAAPLAASRKWLINPGSVGQPRDGMPSASYGLFTASPPAFALQRVPYDVETAARKVREAGLPESLSSRLLKGR